MEWLVVMRSPSWPRRIFTFRVKKRKMPSRSIESTHQPQHSSSCIISTPGNTDHLTGSIYPSFLGRRRRKKKNGKHSLMADKLPSSSPSLKFGWPLLLPLQWQVGPLDHPVPRDHERLKQAWIHC
jgi:hypothetical protein